MSLLKRNGMLVTKGGKLVTTSDPATCSCCGGDGPCPPGKFCSWTPPDPCSTGKCFSFESDDPIECPEGFPYDCTSEQACNQWYEAHPNPLCPCWFCEDGVWVDKPAYAIDCSNAGGIPITKPDAGDCLPPPPPECSDDGECGTWYIDIYDGSGGDHPECDDESLHPSGGPFPTVSAAQAWGQANTPATCSFTMNGSPNPDLACRDGKCVPAEPPPGLWCCDGGTEGYFCGERVNVPGIGEMIGDAPIGICNSVTEVDDCSECGPPEPPCVGESEQGTWQLELCDEEDCKYVTCGQGGSGVGPKFLTQQACRDCHNLRETCSLDHPLCVLNRNPLP